jgi:hypothetical protein
MTRVTQKFSLWTLSVVTVVSMIGATINTILRYYASQVHG